MRAAGRRPTVAIVQRHLPHYRRAFFVRLAQANPDLEIRLHHGGALGEGGAGDAPPLDDGPVLERRVRNFRLLPRLGYDLVAQPEIVSELLRSPADVVVLEGTFGVVTNMLILLARRAARRPTLYWSAGWDRPGVEGWRHPLKTRVIRRLCRSADGFIAYGSTARDYLVRHGADAARVTVAQNTIDVEGIAARSAHWHHRGAELVARLGLAGRRLVTYVGGISPLKRVPVLVAAYRELRRRRPDLALLLVGDGPQAAELRASCRDLPDVHFAGEIVDGVEAYIAAGEVFVLPGTGGLALNQAMALGKPVVATVADGTQVDLIDEDRNGYIVPPDDPARLADALERALDPARTERMGAASASMVLERASLAGMVAAFSRAVRAPLLGARAAT